MLLFSATITYLIVSHYPNGLLSNFLEVPVTFPTLIWNNVALLFMFIRNISPGSHLKPSQQCVGIMAPAKLSLHSNCVGKVQLSTSKRSFAVQASSGYSLCPCLLILTYFTPCLWLGHTSGVVQTAWV